VIERIRNRLGRDLRKRLRAATPYHPDTTYGQPPVPRWYFGPLLATPETFRADCGSADAVRGVVDVLEKLTPDPFVEENLRFYRAGLERFADRWRYPDLTTVLHGVCRNMRVASYLEIGVLRGRSMAVVAALHPEAEIFGFDRWIRDYVGTDSPGPDFVRGELAKVGYRGKATFVDGPSGTTVKRFLDEHPDLYFDLATVDGDHSPAGARRDLRLVIPRLKVGGVLMFDDLANPEHEYLQELWETEVARSGRFVTTSFLETGHGVAFGMKKY
jgi:predicted O-methyltransferase YrrM